MGEAAAICVRCGRDASGRARVRDGGGRCICVECLSDQERARIKPEAKPGEKPPATPAPKPAVAGAMIDLAAPEPPTTTPDGIIPLADEPIVDADTPRICASCGRTYGKLIPLCPYCGYDDRVGYSERARAAAGRLSRGTLSCPKCGYDMRGMKKPQCPECGTVIRRLTTRDLSRREADALARREYRTPILMIVISWALAGLFFGAQGYADVALYWYFQRIVELPIGLLAFWICTHMFIEFDAPWGLTVLRLAGVYAVAGLASAMGSSIGNIPTLGLIFGTVVYLPLLKVMLDLEFEEAVWLGMATWIVGLMVVMFVG